MNITRAALLISSVMPAPSERRSFDQLVSLLSSEKLTRRERLRLEIELVLSAAAGNGNPIKFSPSKHFRDRRGAWARRQ